MPSLRSLGKIYRAFAVTNLLLVASGFLLLATSVGAILAGRVGNDAQQPYFMGAYWTMVAINCCFLGLLAHGTIDLLRLKKAGVLTCNLVFLAEIIYFIALRILGTAVPRDVGMSAAAATGVGNMGLALQLISGYPLIALVCLNLARRRLACEAGASSPTN